MSGHLYCGDALEYMQGLLDFPYKNLYSRRKSVNFVNV